jgi:hypothetical protein
MTQTAETPRRAEPQLWRPSSPIYLYRLLDAERTPASG